MDSFDTQPLYQSTVLYSFKFTLIQSIHPFQHPSLTFTPHTLPDSHFLPYRLKPCSNPSPTKSHTPQDLTAYPIARLIPQRLTPSLTEPPTLTLPYRTLLPTSFTLPLASPLWPQPPHRNTHLIPPPVVVWVGGWHGVPRLETASRPVANVASASPTASTSSCSSSFSCH